MKVLVKEFRNMLTTENDPRLPEWLNRLLNRSPFLVNMEVIHTLAFGYGASDNDPLRPNWIRFRLGKFLQSMYWNAPLFIRVTWSWETSFIGSILSLAAIAILGSFEVWMLLLFFGWWIFVRWTPERTTQIGMGHKLNGRYAITCRLWLSDARAAEGEQGPNLGQQTGWMWGTH